MRVVFDGFPAQFVRNFGLGIVAVLIFQPADPIVFVDALLTLGDDAFKVPRTNLRKTAYLWPRCMAHRECMRTCSNQPMPQVVSSATHLKMEFVIDLQLGQ
jgi:hypothetical protein